MKSEQSEKLRLLPSVHEVISDLISESDINENYEISAITWAVRNVLEKVRAILLSTEAREKAEWGFATEEFWEYPLEAFAEKLTGYLRQEVLRELKDSSSTLKRIINATGVILHTNCGRAILSPEVANFVAKQAGVYSNLELDIETGRRGLRYDHVQDLLIELTGAEAALVVNNNAAAVLLIMNTLANQKEVVVSRGELVEVGGSFRIPDVLKAGGAKLVEVGATNKTWLKDYQEAVGPETAMLLKVHTSNFRIEGFQHSVLLEELVQLGVEQGIVVVEDLGSGSFIDGEEFGLPKEPTIQQAVKTGASLVTFSGDKLLGGPQAGIIVGKRELIEKLKSNQLLRAIRVDKLTLAALAATLQLYQRGEVFKIPVWKMIAKTKKELHKEAENLRQLLAHHPHIQVEVEENYSSVGGGAFPTSVLPTFVCAIKGKNLSATQIEKVLRTGAVPILARIEKGKILLDPRTLLADDIQEIAQCLQMIE